MIEGGSEGVIGGTWNLGMGLEVHPIVGVFVAHGCAMVSKSIHIPKP
jgi:CDP-diacylglycerol--serine O-phosphatidyltransferase